MLRNSISRIVFNSKTSPKFCLKQCMKYSATAATQTGYMEKLRNIGISAHIGKCVFDSVNVAYHILIRFHIYF